jgi:poly(glycerol-phosphate) alpha-glucosyltransferase
MSETIPNRPSSRIRLGIYSVAPSPYQRDMFAALHARPELDLQVRYWEPTLADSPWPEKPLESYETVMPRSVLRFGKAAFYLNWHRPRPQDFDLILLNGYMSTVPQQILRSRRRHGVPVVFWAERMHPASGGLKGAFQRFMARPLEQLDRVVAIGTVAERYYRDRWPDMPIDNLPYLCDLAPFHAVKPLPPEETPLRILFCGQMIKRKGVDLLLEAFAEIIASGRPARLVLVGWEAELPAMLEGLPEAVREAIEFAGFQPPEALPGLFAQAHIFILPSRYDGWGVVVNQAVGAGLPVVVTEAVGASHDLVQDGDNGLVIAPGSAPAIRDALCHYLDDPKRIEKAGQRSRERSFAITPEAGAARWVEIIHQTLDAARKG